MYEGEDRVRSDFADTWTWCPTTLARRIVERGVDRFWLDRLRDMCAYVIADNHQFNLDHVNLLCRVVSVSGCWPLPRSAIVIEREDGKLFTFHCDRRRGFAITKGARGLGRAGGLASPA